MAFSLGRGIHQGSGQVLESRSAGYALAQGCGRCGKAQAVENFSRRRLWKGGGARVLSYGHGSRCGGRR